MLFTDVSTALFLTVFDLRQYGPLFKPLAILHDFGARLHLRIVLFLQGGSNFRIKYIYTIEYKYFPKQFTVLLALHDNSKYLYTFLN